jgi:hypothetical protein
MSEKWPCAFARYTGENAVRKPYIKAKEKKSNPTPQPQRAQQNKEARYRPVFCGYLSFNPYIEN